MLKKYARPILFVVYFLFMAVSFIFEIESGKKIGDNFFIFFISMLKILPCAFILIGLFEVHVKKETIEKHFGQKSGLRGYILVLLLSGTTIGGLYVAFPVAYSLYNKGARLSIIFTYIYGSAICRIPMTIFEASFLGLKFTAIRFAVSLPLVIIFSFIMEKLLEKTNWSFAPGK